MSAEVFLGTTGTCPCPGLLLLRGLLGLISQSKIFHAFLQILCAVAHSFIYFDCLMHRMLPDDAAPHLDF